MVDGIGEKKKEDYGDHVLDVIRDYLMNQTHKKTIKGKTYIETLQLLQQGKSPDQIASERNLQLLTVYSHIGTLFEKGESIEIHHYIPRETCQIIGDKWMSMDQPKDLKQVYEGLQGKYEYYEIRLGISWMKRSIVT